MTTLLFFDDWPLHHREHLVCRAGWPEWVPEGTLEDEIVDGTWNFPFVFHDAGAGVWKALYQGVSHMASDTASDTAEPDGARRLTHSHDGWRFNRTFREPFLPRNERGEPGGGGIYPSTLLVDAEHRVRIYSGGACAAHFQSREVTDAALLLHTLRLDGFCFLAADAGPPPTRESLPTLT